MARAFRFRHLALIAALAAGCGGEERDTITGPGPTLDSVRLNLFLITPFSNAIKKAKLQLDGRDVAEVIVVGEGSPQVALDATVRNVERGSHVLRVVIVEQASSPNPYIVAGAIITPNAILDLAPVQGNLATGEGIEIRVTF